eukprot:scaffold128682_cov63-Phaeocystis_antarctica.AAC.6
MPQTRRPRAPPPHGRRRWAPSCASATIETARRPCRAAPKPPSPAVRRMQPRPGAPRPSGALSSGRSRRSNLVRVRARARARVRVGVRVPCCWAPTVAA